jgi:Ribosomal protein L11, RNA binding domain
MPDLNATTIEAAMRIVEGTAKNMGLKVQLYIVSTLNPVVFDKGDPVVWFCQWQLCQVTCCHAALVAAAVV